MIAVCRKYIGAFLLLLLSVNGLANYPAPPTPFRYVSDYTATLTSSEQQTLENALVEYGRKTSSQIAVVIIPSTNGEEIAEYTFNLGNKWGIGRQKENNGVLFLIAKNDRKVFIATGYGLEGALPDAVVSSIIRNEITPYFKQSEYAEGIAKGLSAIILATQGEYKPVVNTDEGESEIDLLFFLFFAFVIVLIFFPTKGKNVYISPKAVDRIIRTTSSGYRSGGFSGGFGGGQSGGSGGGFGGGRFGGGGAGGSW